jgi:exodeoxyribonuclease VII small subunit
MANQRKLSDDEPALTSAGEQPDNGAKFPQNGAKFEDQLENLETIVNQIDSGELSLEESIDAFERGVRLVRSLNRKLDEVERRVEVLMRGADGELKSTPYEGEGGAEETAGTAKKDDDIPF